MASQLCFIILSCYYRSIPTKIPCIANYSIPSLPVIIQKFSNLYLLYSRGRYLSSIRDIFIGSNFTDCHGRSVRLLQVHAHTDVETIVFDRLLDVLRFSVYSSAFEILESNVVKKYKTSTIQETFGY